MSFIPVRMFEQQMAQFYNAPYAVAVDCCTHGLELALRYTNAESISVPEQTYLSIPMLASKLNIGLEWKTQPWKDYYYITHNIVDAAVYWKKKSYIPGTFFVLSFQFKKHLSLGRGGMILTDNKQAATILRSMAYDGRQNSEAPWDEHLIERIGYHYYMTPEIAQTGIHKFNDALCKEPKQWSYKDYPNIKKMLSNVL